MGTNSLPASVNSVGVMGAQGIVSNNVSESQVLDKKRLTELVKEVDPAEQLDDDVEDVLLQIADDFIEQTVSQACALAKHRKAGICGSLGLALKICGHIKDLLQQKLISREWL